MIDAYVALGSNLGDPLAQLRRATSALAGLPETRLAAISAVYRSAAIGPGTQPEYLNAAVRLTTALAPLALLDHLQAIETSQGREREQRWGARTLDLDLLLYGDRSVDQPRLTVPHPRLTERPFALFPLADVATPKLVLPDGRELDKLLRDCPRGDLTRTGLTLRDS